MTLDDFLAHALIACYVGMGLMVLGFLAFVGGLWFSAWRGL